ncbi:hypothetical protein HNR42_000703 [Deinobacterium chartae]|uniref:Uncharacterized protein n=1 Tax=Deinobacterium chartae TaxID=521158 RepID=A0A841HYJ2_9DEIO|nr:hypothetical protein [Deinobacterium chartae]MBB6097289.1 hypothetical protein [Deinobacterium chartae]
MNIRLYLEALEALLSAMAVGTIPAKPIQQLIPDEVPEDLRSALLLVQEIRRDYGVLEEPPSAG